MKSFAVPAFYRSPLISRIKEFRKTQDPRKKDSGPTVVEFGPVSYYIARHFGFCYGVENAIEIAFRALEENPGKRIFLLSEMIHNPEVNRDLRERGVNFLQDTYGRQLIPFETLLPSDIVMIPAFGAPLDLLRALEDSGIHTEKYNTTCPFVERVWKKSLQIGKSGHTIIIHGKYDHEETRSTFSRSAEDSDAVVVVKNMEEAQKLSAFMLGNRSQQEFEQEFRHKHTPGFKLTTHFEKIGVINQTTMLAAETDAIAQYFRDVMSRKFGAENLSDHFADTRDTLCYATNENQEATYGLQETDADLAIVIGGYNSSNTSHLVELCSRRFPTYFIASDKDIYNRNTISHYDPKAKEVIVTHGYLPDKRILKIVLTSGASCPDSLMESVIHRINSFFPDSKNPDIASSNLRTYSHKQHAP
jgi:4-hydroxy-3-methylbut-2-enyl diphosphate reductase